MTTREGFEAWLVSGYLVGGTFEQHWRVMDSTAKREVELAWRVWQAAKEQYLEEAAKECDLMSKSYDASFELERSDAAEQCAMGIRALKD